LGSDAPVVKGFIPLSVHDSIQLGKTVYLVDKNDKGQVFEGTIVSISPSVIGIVDTSTPIVPRTVKGRMFTVESPATSRWIESEQVIILLDKPSDSIIQKWLVSLSSWLSITRHN
ncbi:MAG: hypothetical protein O3C43_19570, partial [Verrucomicrobia bacterium]|nr:hypothetical protein [Verrucomicrobiota bacterium]